MIRILPYSKKNIFFKIIRLAELQALILTPGHKGFLFLYLPCKTSKLNTLCTLPMISGIYTYNILARKKLLSPCSSGGAETLRGDKGRRPARGHTGKKPPSLGSNPALSAAPVRVLSLRLPFQPPPPPISSTSHHHLTSALPSLPIWSSASASPPRLTSRGGTS